MRTDQIILSRPNIWLHFALDAQIGTDRDITLGLPEVAHSPYKLHDPFETEKLGVYLGQAFAAGFVSNFCGST